MRSVTHFIALLSGVVLALAVDGTFKKPNPPPDPQPQSRIEHSKPVRLDPDTAFPSATIVHDDATGHDYLVVWNTEHAVVTPMLSDSVVPTPHAIDTRVSY